MNPETNSNIVAVVGNEGGWQKNPHRPSHILNVGGRTCGSITPHAIDHIKTIIILAELTFDLSVAKLRYYSADQGPIRLWMLFGWIPKESEKIVTAVTAPSGKATLSGRRASFSPLQPHTHKAVINIWGEGRWSSICYFTPIPTRTACRQHLYPPSRYQRGMALVHY